jgi:predicted ATPase/DNA-binding CsgD family transcriptional regulator
VQGEHERSLEPLPLPTGDVPADAEALGSNDAVRLFVERAGAVDPGLPRDAAALLDIAEICRRLDGLPLAIELAAGRIRVLPPAILRARLERRLPELTSGRRDAPARQQTVRDTIAWSYDLLTPDEQALFRRLGVFTGGFTLEAAQAVASGSPVDDVVPVLERLVEQNLVRRMEAPGDPRFTMLETIREFALDRLQESDDEDDACDQHAAFFHRFIADLDLHHAVSGDASWFRPVAAEEDNLRRALTRLAERGAALALNDLSAALDVFWWTRWQMAEARFWLEQAIACDAGLPAIVRARSRGDAGFLLARSGEYEAAAPLLAEALALARECDDPYFLADMLFAAGDFAKLQGELRQAQAFGEETERVARAIVPGAPHASYLAAAALGMQADIARLSGDYDTAIARHGEAIRLYRAAGGTWYLCVGLIELGLAHAGAGDAKGAAEPLLEALAHAWQLSAVTAFTNEWREEIVVTNALRGLAVVAAVTDQPHVAARLLGATDTLDRDQRVVTAAEWRNQEPMTWCLAHLHATIDSPTLHVLRQMGAGLSLGEAVALGRDVAQTVLGPARVEELWHATGAPDPGPTPPLAAGDTGRQPIAPRAEGDLTLTFREQEVLMLLCQRLTDAEIAQRLFLSPRTASRHVGNILGKLGAANRREAAAIAVRRHLV